ncbi:stage V sporulation protein AA [Halobacillus fulvus]|nr:stage V sporulation protein AA [Halobacillus fulvus]
MSTIYIRMKQSLTLPSQATIRLDQVAKLAGPKGYMEELQQLILCDVKEEDGNIVVIDGLSVIHKILERYPTVETELLGPNQCVVHLEKPKKGPSPLLVSAIWLLLFIGAATAIMNFHYDVSMEAVQQKLHFMLTGNETDHPLWIQVPYSIGLGLGMILFFNHWFKKKFNEEPSPMEIEIFNYQENLDHYVAVKENKVEKRDVDH